MPFDTLTRDIVCERLVAAGLRLQPVDVQLEAREDRWVVRLPEMRLAWFAASDRGRRRLMQERRVLRLLETRCTFLAPRVLFEDPSGDFDVRGMVPGITDPWRTFAELRDSTELAVRVGRGVGAILAEQHTRVRVADVSGWLPHKPSWPEPLSWIRARLGHVVDDPKLVKDAEAIIANYEGLQISEVDRVLVHGDVGFHNLVIDPSSHVVRGIFDYDGAAWADRHHDFRYLMFDRDRFDLLEAALSVYEPAVGHPISRKRLLLYNAACAISFLAATAGTQPDERPCGRTLAEDLRWTRYATSMALGVAT
jgi:hypothetical protein